MPYNAPSLRAQAVAMLAQREHSELELRRKLLRRLRRNADAAATGASAERAATTAALGTDPSGAMDEATTEGSPAAQIDAVVSWLRERGYLDEARFVDSRVHARAGRFGPARIQQELSRHGLALPAEVARTLRSTELDQATQLWQRKFGRAAVDAREAARQARFLAGRGFSAEVVHHVLRAVGRRLGHGSEGD